jgi:hypothetical protein
MVSIIKENCDTKGMVTPENLVRLRNDFRQVHETIERDREELRLGLKRRHCSRRKSKLNPRSCVKPSRTSKTIGNQYRKLLKQIPNVDDFSDEEVEKRSGKASALLDIASKIAIMKVHVPRKVEKLRSLLK